MFNTTLNTQVNNNITGEVMQNLSLNKLLHYLKDGDPYKQRETEKFIDNHKNSETENFAVIMYMVGALDYFSDKTDEHIEAVAFELAYIGMDGIDPTNIDGYKITSIPTDDKFSGYKTIAYFYVSWMLHAPDHIGELGMAFAREYNTAKTLRRILSL